MNFVFCRGCGKQIHETAMMCPQCGAPQLLPAQNTQNQAAPKKSMGWLVVIALAVSLLSVVGLIEYVPGISRTVSEWIAIIFGIALISLTWMFLSEEKRQKFVINRQVDLSLFWRELRSTFGDGIMWFFIIACGVIGSLIGASLLRSGS